MIRIKYKCRCMGAEAEIEAPTRPLGGDLMLWMTVVQGCVGLDHQSRSPNCRATEMEFVKIPMDDDAPGLGMKPPLAS